MATKHPDKQLAALKVPPHSIEAEQAVLGGVMLDNTAWEDVVTILTEQDFYQKAHKNIFQAISELSRRNEPFDVITLAEYLKKNNQLDYSGGEVYLFELANNTPSVANISAYSNIVRERSVLRQLLDVANEVATSAYNPGTRSSNELLNLAESKVFAIAEQQSKGSGPVDISSLMTKTYERIQTLSDSKTSLIGLSTGFKDLDDKTSGLQKGDLIIAAGRPSMGKTTFAMNIAEHTAIGSNLPVLVFSMEMPGESLAMRMMSSLGRIDLHRVRSGNLKDEDWPRIISAVGTLSEAPMFIDDTPALSPAEMLARARRIARQQGELGLIVIDYLQLMQVPGYRENRVNEITEISRSLKIMAKELNVPVLALSQLNRGLEQRTDKRPVMSDLRESGAIEQDADIILFVYRDEVYHDDTPDKGIAEIIIGKQRNGPIGKIKLSFFGQYTKFENHTQTVYGG
ncbi:MAG: replicative DNA helicase [Gammaproteobacteria bacterium]|nr:replicative DNA helicase [Gammaproteobacteria bacterium]